MKQKLGRVQVEVLKSLRRFGKWTPRGIGGWVWDTPSRTLRIMESLERRGLVHRDDQGVFRPGGGTA